MSPYREEFVKLNILLENHLGELKAFYKIKVVGIPSAYDVFNSKRVDEFLESRHHRVRQLQRGNVDLEALKRRFNAAYEIARNDFARHQDNRQFGDVVQKALNTAHEILKDPNKEAAYAAWYDTQQRTPDEEKARREVDTARREADAAKREVAELRRRAEEAERTSQERERRRREEAEHREAERAGELERQLEIERQQREQAERQAQQPKGWASVAKGFFEALAARSDPANRAVLPEPAAVANLTGVWRAPDGHTCRIWQSGNGVRIQLWDPWNRPVADSAGTFDGELVNVNFTTGPVPTMWGFVPTHGVATLRLVNGGYTLQGQSVNHVTGQTLPILLQRVS
jgi:hypothetical protein